MATRYIGEAVIRIAYHDSGDYRGTISAGGHVWRFADLYAPRIPTAGHVGSAGVAYDSSAAYDEMAASAIAFASYYTSRNRGDDVPEWAPPAEVADAIESAALAGMAEEGGYEVRRSRGGKATVHE